MQNNYSKREIKRIVKQDVELPKLVQERVNETLQQLEVPDFEEDFYQRRNKSYGKTKLFRNGYQVAAAFALVLCLGTVATVGAVSLWNEYAAQKYDAAPKIQKELVDKKVATIPEAMVEKSGVKIETQQCIADDRGYMYLLFKVTVPDTIELTEDIFFEDSSFTKDGKDLDMNMGGGISENEDGSLKIEPENHVFYYEYNIRRLDKLVEDDIVTVTFHNLINCVKTVVEEVLIEEDWSLDIPVAPAKLSQSFVVKDGTLSCGATVKEVTLSPIGIQIEYNFVRKTRKAKAVIQNEDGTTEEETIDEMIDPTQATAYELKDGTKKELVVGGGSMGYRGGSNTEYICDFELLQVVDVDNVAAIYFGEERVELCAQ
ncbi:MAG: hypothetical protein J6D02_11420 [Lachnospira sp.]|nr:hypothetical protein [Lachnospira sp.]